MPFMAASSGSPSSASFSSPSLPSFLVLSTLFLSFFKAPIIVAAPWDGPEPTPAELSPPEVAGWSPRPTQDPLLGRDGGGLFRRQFDALRTCGYIDGQLSSSLTCPVGSICATYSRVPVAGCCHPSSLEFCTMPTACVASSDMTQCNSACTANSWVAKCTNSALPFCYNRIYNYVTETFTEFGCDSIDRTQVAELTYEGQMLFSSFSFVGISRTDLETSTTTSSQTPSPTPPPPDDESSTNVGAIVGGVVGGLGVLGIAAFAIVFLILRNRRKAKAEATAADPAAAAMMGPTTEYKPPPVQQEPSPYFPNDPQRQSAAFAGGYPPHDSAKTQYMTAQTQPAFSPPGSPAPQYMVGQPHAPSVSQLDGQAVQQPYRPSVGPNGQPVHEAP